MIFPDEFDWSPLSNPYDYEAWFDYGIDLNNQALNQAAFFCFQQALNILELNLSEDLNCEQDWQDLHALLSRESPDNYEIWDDCGITFNNRGNYDSKYYSEKGNTLYELGRYGDALNALYKAIELESNNPEYYYKLGSILYEIDTLDCDQAALYNFDIAIQLNPQNSEYYFKKGNTLYKLGRYGDALDDLNKAIQFESNNPEYYSQRGSIFYELEDYERALSDFDKVAQIQPKNDIVWENRAKVLRKLRDFRGLLNIIKKSCQEAIKIKQDDYHSWFFLAVVNSYEQKYLDSVKLYSQALELQPEFPDAWYEKGQDILRLTEEQILHLREEEMLHSLEKYDEAIHCYDKAIEFGNNYFLAHNGKGNALRSRGKEKKIGYENDFNTAIEEYRQALQLSENSYWYSWRNMGLAYQYKQQYKEAINAYNQGLKKANSNYLKGGNSFVDIKSSQQGCIELSYEKGKCLYNQGKRELNYNYREQAKESFEKALQYCSDRNLERKYSNIREYLITTIEDLISDYRALGYTEKSNELVNLGSEHLNRLLEMLPQNGSKIIKKFARLNQFVIESLATSPNLEERKKAVEKAEERKNLCLSWMRFNQNNSLTIESPSYSEIQELLSDNTAVIYWHISPSSITVFIMQSNQDFPDVISSKDNLKKFLGWMEEWRKKYRKYSRLKNENIVQFEENEWRRSIQSKLKELFKILDIQTIVQHIPKQIKQLILIPHRDLQLLPLNYLFNLTSKVYTTTYLPSAKIGIELQNHPYNLNEPVLLVENFYTETIKKVIKRSPTWKLLKKIKRSKSLYFSVIESSIIQQIYKPNVNSLLWKKATKEQVVNSLKRSKIFLFTGHGYHELNKPRESALNLADGDKLTVRDILELDLSNYYLACLSACESGITGSSNLIDNYVGVVSAFLAAGVSHVVSTLWTVDDTSSALLMIKFHELLKKENKTPACALNDAQNWLRKLTHDDIATYYRKLAAQLSLKQIIYANYLEEQAKQHEQKAREIKHKKHLATMRPKYIYEDPYYWAGFMLTGTLCF